jgi:hypothetical protein
VTTDSQVKVKFVETLPNSRGSDIYAVQLAMDDGAGGEFTTVVGADEALPELPTSYIAASGIVKGRFYRFKCRVRNTIGWSAWSSPNAYIRAAVSPGKPQAPELASATATDMVLNFFAPEDNGGSPLTLFELFINDGTEATEPTTQVTSYTSNLLTHTLSATTDTLTAGTIYKLRFRATNEIGESQYSDVV